MNLLKYITNRKYRFFYRKLKDVQAAIWEQDFKVAKSRQIREGVRQDRERAIDSLQLIEARIKGTNDKKDKAALEKEKSAFEDNVKRYEAQMKMIDQQINGVPASGDNPGEEGINNRIEGLAELREMYRQYLTTI